MSSREDVNTNFYNLWFDPTGNQTRVYRSVADALSTRSLISHRAKVLKMAMAYAVEVCSRIFKIRLFVAVGLLHWVTVLRIIRFPYYNPFLIRGSGSCSG